MSSSHAVNPLSLNNGQPMEPIAIVGMACRFPGSDGLSSFWRQLINGENAVVEGPAGSIVGRWGPQFPAFFAENEAIRFGAFIEDIDLFDAEFFKMSPIEAQMLDPQQRLMLETSWRAFEDAAIDPDTLMGSRTGVYAGISGMDYKEITVNSPETDNPAGGLYAVTGTALNTAIGRVSYAFGLEGPSMAIDTACSSSLVAIHLAVGGLQRRETDLALAGGVHIYLTGRPVELRANAGMVSPTGQCRTFDASADGFACGEGCGLVVLKRLSEAQDDGDRIWAVIRGTSVNQDGASQGLTVPSGPSQERAMVDALSTAGIPPSEVDYLEAHGTGTVVGDPIEVNAAAAVYGLERNAERPLLIGSVKTNIGHLGPAAGVAGLIKTVMAMKEGVIPQILNYKNPNPNLDWDRLPVKVTDQSLDWPCCDGRLPLAGVNSFGWSGTNAHLLVESHATAEAVLDNSQNLSFSGAARSIAHDLQIKECLGKRESRFLPLSAKSQKALLQTASHYLSWLDEQTQVFALELTAADSALADMAWTAAIGRSHFAHRAGLVFSNTAELRESLSDLVQTEILNDAPAKDRGKMVAFVFTGQASQWVGMSQTLYEREPVFRTILDRCGQLILKERGISLLDVMFGQGDTDGLLDEPAWTQPAIYSLECALVALWESIGVKPNVVIGHSLGEIAAAQTAGAFTLEEGLRYASVRGTLMGTTRSDGAMVAFFASNSRVVSVVNELNSSSVDSELSVAVDNGLQQVVSGSEKELNLLIEHFEAEGTKVVRLKRSPAYHSALVEPVLDNLETQINEIVPTPTPPSLPLISNITGQLLDKGEKMDAAYWRRHARNPVAFHRSIETLAEMGVDVVIEIGPHAVLGPVVSMNWPETAAARTPEIIHSLVRPSKDAEEQTFDTSGGFTTAVAEAYEAGIDINFKGLFVGETRRRISLPGYPFQRTQHWVPISRRRRQDEGHPLLGDRHESPRGETMYETDIYASDPAWMVDHLVYEQVVAPGGLYGAMAVSAAFADGAGPVFVEEMQMYSALMFEGEPTEGETDNTGRKLQLILDASDENLSRHFEIFSKGASEEGWLRHAEGRISTGKNHPSSLQRVDLNAIKADLTRQSTADFYEMRSADKIYLGPFYHTMKAVWAREGEAVGELVLQESVDAAGMEMHPLLLDGCFQVLSMGRYLTGVEHGAVYMPFGWEQLSISGPMPERVICHAVLRDYASVIELEKKSGAPPEVLTGDLKFYSLDGYQIGGLQGFTVKRATQTALLSTNAKREDLLYEIVWRNKTLSNDRSAQDILTEPAVLAAQSQSLADHLAEEGVEFAVRKAFLNELERLCRAYAYTALKQMGWRLKAGVQIQPQSLRRQLKTIDEHSSLFLRILHMLSEAGVLTQSGDNFIIQVGEEDTLPDKILTMPESYCEQLTEKYPHGLSELRMLHRCGSALAEVLQGLVEPLSLLFPNDGTGAAEYYLNSPFSLARNNMLGNVIAAAVTNLPDNRPLRVLEVGAGTGASTEFILSNLPEGRFDFTFTDISAGFFVQAEKRFAKFDEFIEYKPLNIEVKPSDQGFEPHSYDLVIAANVLHATRDLGETLENCRELLIPSGQLIALEELRRRAWQDLTFGLLDGWWRFSDAYRPDYALADKATWRRVLTDKGYSDVEFIGTSESRGDELLSAGIIIARGPEEIIPSPGVWVIAADANGTAEKIATELALRNQRVIVANDEVAIEGNSDQNSEIIPTALEPTERESWRSLLENLPADIPLRGIVHLMALDGHGTTASVRQMAKDVTRGTSTALALTQGIADANAIPNDGVWFVTQGAQALEQDRINRTSGELAGATLWGFGKVMALEAPHLQPRMIDLDPDPNANSTSSLVKELLFSDVESHLAFRDDARYTARMIRFGSDSARLDLPDGSEWCISPDVPENSTATFQVKSQPRNSIQSGEVRVAVDAAGLNFADLLISLGAVENSKEIGREMYGRVLEIAEDVKGLSVGQPVVGMGFGSFAPEMTTPAAMVSPVPTGFATTDLATLPTNFVTAELAFELTKLKAGERVLIHSGAGGVGFAAIQLALNAGAEVFASASSPKHTYLSSLGVKHIFNSRTTAFGDEILKATDGEGVHVLLNSLTGEGFVEANLSCLSTGGRMVEIAKRDIWSVEQMTENRPDVEYFILDLDAIKSDDPVRAGASLSRVISQISSGELTPIPHSVWPLSEMHAAMQVMRDARHTGKVVFRMPPLARGNIRENRTILVTGGMGGLGCAVAQWLADHGAGTIVLNGRRDPDSGANEVIQNLRDSGADVRVEVADITDFSAVDDLLAKIDADMPPLGGVVHCVGVLSDGAIENQTWERFEQVLWPKVLGAWHLHHATRTKDLELFVLFSSVTGVVGNAGQSNHAAANAFLDQLAAHRRALGLPGQSIAWGAWSGIGEAEEQRQRVEQQLAQVGTGWLTPQQGMNAFDWIVKQDVTASTVYQVDWNTVRGELKFGSPFFEEFFVQEKLPTKKTKESTVPDGLISQLRSTPAEARQNLLESFVQQEIQAVLRLSSPPSPTVSFFDLGMDSLMAVELRNRLNRALESEFTTSNTVVFDYPDATSLARHLDIGLKNVTTTDKPLIEPTPKLRQPRRQKPQEDGIAIVGMACRFPGAPDLSAFWRQIEAGECAVMEGRRDPGSWDGILGDPEAKSALHRFGGFVDELDKFDAKFFDVRPIEARGMDPQQRMLLETSWQALEDAGMDPARLKGSRTGVFFGISKSEYQHLLDTKSGQNSTYGNLIGMTLGRISFIYGVEGPVMPVELACASSLVSVHNAVVSLKSGETDMAIAGGVNAILSLDTTNRMDDIGMLSHTGRCWSFDSAADGYVRSEGCGAVILKRLVDAESDGDRIWGVIRGSATNQNGASGSFVMPNGPAQQRVIEEALFNANLEPSQIDFLETHANGSDMGDAIEIHSAAEVYGRERTAEHPLLLGAVKTNIGHLESAAGIAGLIKVLLAMNHGTIPKNIEFNNPNPNVDWDRLPVQVVTELTPWPNNSDSPSYAGISGFSLTGTNSHVVVEGYEMPDAELTNGVRPGFPVGSAQPVAVSLPHLEHSPTEKFVPRRMRMLPISGKSKEALQELASKYLNWLDELVTDLSDTESSQHLLSDIAWTAGVGRSHFEHRAGITFGDAKSLRKGLRKLAQSDESEKPHKPLRVAFVYAAEESCQAELVKELYDSEPVARAVLDECDQEFQKECGTSLLEGMLDRNGSAEDSVRSQALEFAFQSSLTALWSSIGVRPHVVLGVGTGEIAAAHAAGVFTLADGMRFAMRCGALKETGTSETGVEIVPDDLESAFKDIVTNLPSITFISQVTGHALSQSETLDSAYWRSRAYDDSAHEQCAKTLANSSIDTVIEIGTDASHILRTSSTTQESAGEGEAKANNSDLPKILSSLNQSSKTPCQFVELVAEAYQAGFSLDFSGLFVGEKRRRISLPSYPFQRKRFWFDD